MLTDDDEVQTLSQTFPLALHEGALGERVQCFGNRTKFVPQYVQRSVDIHSSIAKR